jgi:hypothetical protein
MSRAETARRTLRHGYLWSCSIHQRLFSRPQRSVAEVRQGTDPGIRLKPSVWQAILSGVLPEVRSGRCEQKSAYGVDAGIFKHRHHRCRASFRSWAFAAHSTRAACAFACGYRQHGSLDRHRGRVTEQRPERPGGGSRCKAPTKVFHTKGNINRPPAGHPAPPLSATSRRFTWRHELGPGEGVGHAASTYKYVRIRPNVASTPPA